MMRPEVKREVYRKLLHMSMGLFALCLRWLTPWQAALCALVALLHNLYLFPHYGMKKLERPEEKERGYSGMIGYPAVVLVIILLSWAWALSDIEFEHSWISRFFSSRALALATASWLFLAVGDALGALCGIFIHGPKLPWNKKKSWAGLVGFLVFGTPAAYFGAWFVCPSLGPYACGLLGRFTLNWVPFGIFILAGLVAAIMESLPGQIDDNLTVPLSAWVVLTLATYEGGPWSYFHFTSNELWTLDEIMVLLLLNAVLAGAAFWRGWVDKWGFLLGLVFGAMVAFGLGIPGYAMLLLFYLVANGSTYYGKKVKEQRGIAEAHGGQRRAGSVFSKGFVPAIFALLSFPAFVASLATYAADTAASEFGKTSRGKTWSLKSMKAVPAGSVGAISLKGTLAGLAVLAFFAGATWLWCLYSPEFPFLPWPAGFPFLGFFVATIFCFFFESWFNEWNASRNYFSKEIIHVMLGGLAGMLTYAPEIAKSIFLLLRGMP
jgi:uncharacterized protein (TIGR00297 family)